jgi:hypothetical protein
MRHLLPLDPVHRPRGARHRIDRDAEPSHVDHQGCVAYEAYAHVLVPSSFGERGGASFKPSLTSKTE